jgi:DHA2 family multidrug resistance protein-like MFS transporter
MSDTAAVALHERPEIHERRWFLLGVMCLSLVLVVMAVSGLNVALPSLQRSLDASATDLQWIVDSYALVFAGLLLSAGAIGDRVGRKRTLVAGLAVFGAGAVVGTLAGSPGAVIAARIVMGLGAAFVMPATLSLLTTIFPPHERRKAIAIWAGFAGAGGALGPLVVGFLLTEWWVFPAHWWGSAFLVNAVTVAFVLVAVIVFAPESRDEDATPLDPFGAVLSLVGLTGLLYGIIEGPERGWTDTGVVLGFAIAVVALGTFVWWELRAEHPMLPMHYFRNRGFSTGSGVITFAFLVMFGFFFLLTQYFQLVRGYSPLDAGVATLPFAATMILVSPRSAVLGERFGVLRVMSMGFFLVVVGLSVMAMLGPDTPYVVIAGGLVVLSSGMAITLAPATGSIMSAVPLNKAGVGSAVNDTTRELGGALGIALLGSIATSAYRDGLDVSGVPPEAAAAASESVGAAVAIANQVGGAAGAELAAEAGRAFTDAFNVTMATGAAIALIAGIVVFVLSLRPDRPAAPHAVDTAPTAEGVAGS